MNKDLTNEKRANGEIVIADECGDSLWDAVLDQDVQSGQVNNTSETTQVLPDDTEKIQVSEETKR